MILYDRNRFFEQYKILLGKLNKYQVKGILFLLGKLEQSEKIILHTARAYVLGTVAWETAYTFEPITEYGSLDYLRKKKYYPYIGRGYVQLTWKENYEKFGKHLNIDLVNNPKLANEPEIAWKILEEGMTDDFGIQDPNFTSWTLEDFFNKDKTDYYNARKIINPRDKKSYKPIAELSKKFYECLTGSIITKNNIPNINNIGE